MSMDLVEGFWVGWAAVGLLTALVGWWRAWRSQVAARRRYVASLRQRAEEAEEAEYQKRMRAARERWAAPLTGRASLDRAIEALSRSDRAARSRNF